MHYGLDIDGTKTALGVSDSGRQLQWEKQVSIPCDGYDAFLDAVCEPVAGADWRFGCKGSVGIGTPEMPEIKDGTLYVVNVLAASGKPLRADLNARLGRDVRPNNGANCSALSEVRDDEFTQYPLVMGLILGTSIGGGPIFDGKPIISKNHIIDEFGHMRLSVDALTMIGLDFPLRHCSCGRHGCIENYLSDRGFAQLYQHHCHQPLQAPEIIALYDQGDEQAKAYVEHYLDLLAVCLGDILTIVDPDLVIIGGGLPNFLAVTM